MSNERYWFDHVISGASVRVNLRRGTNVAAYTITIAGKGEGESVAHFSLSVRVYKPAGGGALVGQVIEQPGTVPGWASHPVVDTDQTGFTVTLAPSGATWRTSVRPDLISII